MTLDTRIDTCYNKTVRGRCREPGRIKTIVEKERLLEVA